MYNAEVYHHIIFMLNMASSWYCVRVRDVTEVPRSASQMSCVKMSIGFSLKQYTMFTFNERYVCMFL